MTRRELARADLAGYEFGPDATTRATARALTKVDGAATVVLVEGITDQIALDTAALGRGRNLEADGVVILPIGGAHAMRRVLTGLGAGRKVAGLYDLGEEEIVRSGLIAAGVGSPRTRLELEQLGFFVCDRDLEEELIRAVGVVGVEALLDAQGELRPLRTFQSQPAWRGQPPEAQLYRFVRSSSVRNLRYARLLVEAALAEDALPRPIDALLSVV
jgi:hypothetical protein